MHLIQSSALTCGAKISSPHIYKTFFPIPYEKFIIFAPQHKIPSKDYLYWQDALNCIFPQLEKQGIKILHIGPKEPIVYNGVINLCGHITTSQTAYLMDKALLFIGIDGFEAHLASHSDIPLICINSSTYANNTGPFFGDKNKQIVFESFLRTGNKKPSFNINESPRSINLIKPEEIAAAAFKLLNIDFKVPFETVFVGEKYSHFTIQEVIPDCIKPAFNSENLVEIRADLMTDEQSLLAQAMHYKKNLIVTDKPLKLDILKMAKPNIQALVFNIKKDNRDIKFLQDAQGLGIKLILISEMAQADIDAQKIYYYELGAITKLKEYPDSIINELKKDIEKLYYRSSKILSSKEKVFYSLAAQEAGIPLANNFEYQKVINTPLFWANIDFFTIVKLRA